MYINLLLYYPFEGHRVDWCRNNKTQKTITALTSYLICVDIPIHSYVYNKDNAKAIGFSLVIKTAALSLNSTSGKYTYARRLLLVYVPWYLFHVRNIRDELLIRFACEVFLVHVFVEIERNKIVLVDISLNSF